MDSNQTEMDVTTLTDGLDDDDQDIIKRFGVAKNLLGMSRLTALYIIFILAIFLLNIFFIVVILESRRLRSSSRHILIVNICLGDLLMALFVLPVLLNLAMRDGQDIRDCTTYFVLHFFADFLIPSLTTLAILVLNLDYILRLCCQSYSDGASRSTLMIFLFFLPWVVSASVLIPLYVDGIIKVPRAVPQTCVIDIGGYLTRILLIVSYFPQAGLLLLFNIIVSVMYLTRRDSYGLDVCGERIRAPVDICLASFATMLLYTPALIITLLTSEGYLGCQNTEECRALNKVNTAASWLMLTKFWVTPLCWLACRDTRAAIRHLLGCC
ncbi:5-hydroxytryptamine receptor 2B [Biomphalaria pfeifferi]|uniref:5-hydroxytryptamine receptor 2B n=1 Tax=Biomphalaria pfeifferi TaxID=112525 RepID=A0AAD8F557_BIOPF|nr:5-hydroxytryptamine receptor 2B [Biomphalaria pfeifferi]